MMEKPSIPGNAQPGFPASALEYPVRGGRRSVRAMTTMA
jgi:hypothetical protein